MLSQRTCKYFPYLSIQLLLIVYCASSVNGQASNNDSKVSRQPKEKGGFGKGDFLEFIKGKLTLTARIHVGPSPKEGNKPQIVFMNFKESGRSLNKSNI